MLRSLTVWLALAGVVAIAAVLVSLYITSSDDDAPSATLPTPTATADTSADAVEVRAVAERFVKAVNEQDRDTLYALQTLEYQRVCTREQFEQVPAGIDGQLSGPVTVQVAGGNAGAQVTQSLPDGRVANAAVPLKYDVDGQWKLSPPSTTGCTP